MNKKIKQNDVVKSYEGRETFYTVCSKKVTCEMRSKWQEGASHANPW